MRGREFPALLEEFELYRLRTGQSDLRLLRTKPWKRPWKWAWWFDRSGSPKWKVPYVPAEQVPSALPHQLMNTAVTPEEQAQAHLAARDYLENLH